MNSHGVFIVVETVVAGRRRALARGGIASISAPSTTRSRRAAFSGGPGGSAGPEIGASPSIDYREWLDAVGVEGEIALVDVCGRRRAWPVVALDEVVECRFELAAGVWANIQQHVAILGNGVYEHLD